MDVATAALLGLVQGVTEFLPISSSGHLALASMLLGIEPDLSFEVFLHGATLIAMLIYFRHDIVAIARALIVRDPRSSQERSLAWGILVATFVSALIALTLSPYLEAISSSPMFVGAGFLITSTVMVVAERLRRHGPLVQDPHELHWRALVGIGVFQGIAALPGVSRSGSTMAGGMFAGLGRDQAARLSFLLGIPIIALASAKDGLDVLTGGSSLPGLVPSAVGFTIAGLSAYLSIAGLLAIVKRHSLATFAAYTATLGTAMLIVGIIMCRG